MTKFSMFERRIRLGLLIGLMVCVSIWRMSTQDMPLLTNETDSKMEYRSQLYGHPEDVYLFPATATPTTPIVFATEVHHVNTSSSSAPAWTDHLLPEVVTAVIDAESLPKDDFHTLIDFANFTFLINQPACQPHLVVLILVHSAPKNVDKRTLIRQTWGSVVSPKMRLIFLVGAVNSSEVQHALAAENHAFGDMVQGNFVDAYRNMTYKHIMAFKWFTYYCPEAKYLLKVDDDVYVNTFRLIEQLDRPASTTTTAPTAAAAAADTKNYPVPTPSLFNVQRKNLIFCHLQAWSRAKRSYRSKWRVSFKEYPGRYYPPCCPGYSILYSADAVFRLYVEAQRSRYFWIDDVHVTGTLSQQANITVTSFEDYLLKADKFDDIVANGRRIREKSFLFSWPDIGAENIRKLWAMTIDQRNTENVEVISVR